MNLFELFGTIAISNATANRAIDETTEKAGESSSKLGKFIGGVADFGVKVGKVVGAGLAVSGGAIAKIGKDAISAYADYEQLVGGVETLFKDSAGIVQGYADNAFRTAGLSANDYMETVTSFSASLLQSLDGDTAKAAEKANTAITDMADNANKMGTSMASIQNAYQGFAKQNYTMLDNLKLGYGGTKEEMERLLSDASKISGIKYDVSSYSDIVDAIHVVQTEMGITGTTAKEASATIQGPLSSAKSAWTNLITGLADGNQDFGLLVNNFFDSIVNVADNIVPKISQVLETLPSLITKLVPKLISKASEVFSQLLPAVINGATSLLNAVVSVLPQFLDALISAIPELISGVEQVFYAIVDALPGLMQVICEALPDLIPQLITALVNMIVYLCENLMTIIQPLLDNLPAIIISIVDALMDNLPTLIQGLITLVLAIVEALPEIIMALIEAIPIIVTSVLEGLWNALPILLEGLGQIMIKLLEPIWNALSPFFEDLMNFFSSIWDGIVSVFSAVGAWVYDNIIAPVANFFQGLWEGILEGLKAMINGVIWAVNKLIDGVNVLLTPLRAIIVAVGDLFGADFTMDNVSIPKIPKLAQGGIVSKPTVVETGEDGAEAIVPLENNTGWIDKVAKRVHTLTVDSIKAYNPERSVNQNRQIEAIDILSEKLDKLILMLSMYFPDILNGMNNRQLVLDGNSITAAILPLVDAQLGDLAQEKARGN